MTISVRELKEARHFQNDPPYLANIARLAAEQIERLETALREVVNERDAARRLLDEARASGEPRDGWPTDEHVARFGKWLAQEMPAGTVIGDPTWWQRKLLNAAYLYAAPPASSQPPVPEWQPIETAPRGGKWLLLWWPDITDAAVVGYCNNKTEWHTATSAFAWQTSPTHWMPLPSGPTKPDVHPFFRQEPAVPGPLTDADRLREYMKGQSSQGEGSAP